MNGQPRSAARLGDERTPATPSASALHRERDPTARRLLAELERLEAEPWPAALDDYARCLLTLGQRCEQPAGMAEFHRWATDRLRSLLNGRSARWREWRADALADVTATVAGTLWIFRAGLHPSRRPNLRSMVGAAVIWRANDIAESLHARHTRHLDGVAQLGHVAASARACTTVYAREVVARLTTGLPCDRALLLVGQGETIAEAARRTGVSRQQVYRAREALREAL